MSTRYEGNAAEKLALDTFIKLMRGAESIMSRSSVKLVDVGLTTSQFGVLEAVYHLGPLCQKEIAEKILKSTGNMTLVIDNLEKQSLVRRERDTTDRRYYRIHLTEKGKELMDDLFPRHAAHICEEMSCLSDEEKNELGKLCKKLGRNKTE